MIRINLLPVRAAKKKEFGRNQLILFGLVIVGAAVGNFFWYSNRSSELDKCEQRITKVEADIKMLEKTIGEVKTIEGDKKALEEKLKVLEVLKKNRTGPVKLMDELAQIIPTKVWLVDLAEDAGAIALKGRAASHEDVAIFLKKLKGSKHFKDIQLKKAMATASGVVDFDIMGKADYQAG